MRALEFYSGLGGLHYSLLQARRGEGNVEVLAAFDINDLANRVYEHNHGLRPNPADIRSLTPSFLAEFKADTWLVSLPSLSSLRSVSGVTK